MKKSFLKVFKITFFRLNNKWVIFMGRIKKFIDRLAKSNKETFGKGGLDCCSMNKDGVKTNKYTAQNFKTQNTHK